jgi:hypothetical protein
MDTSIIIEDSELSPADWAAGDSLLLVSADFAASAERDWESRQHADLKQRSKRRQYGRDQSKMSGAPFCFWDGEGPRDAGYALFGSSMGDVLKQKHLTTIQCLDLLLERARQTKAIHVWFGGNYDVSMILHDLGFRRLAQLKKTKTTVYRGYRIRYVPRKWFSVSNGQSYAKVYDVVSFFASNFQTAVDKFGIATPEEIRFLTENKEKRNKFLWRDIDDIEKYWRLELRLGAALMDSLRDTFADAGFRVNSWHGPGALASVALKRHNIKAAMYAQNPNQLPMALEIERYNAVRYAYAGGRFEMVHGGYFNDTIYNADIRSAYPYFATHLPNLARGIWRYCYNYEPGKFGVYHIKYKAPDGKGKDYIYPLFDRRKDGRVVWINDVEGWYWNPEADLVANDKDAIFLEGWVFDEDDENDRPFAWLADYYHKRKLLEATGNAAEFTFKLIINSVYGQLAQRTGWDERKRKAPRYHQLEWAGYITSACRAKVYSLAKQIPSSELVSIDTDGIYATCPLPVQPSTNLGGWDIDSYSRGLFWQSGIYCLADKDGNWKKGKAKSRGIPTGNYSYEILREHYDNGMVPLSLIKNTFIGFGLALNGQFDKLNTWVEQPQKVSFGGGGGLAGNKRYHNKRHCKDDCNGDVHVFQLGLFRPEMSNLHRLPWLEVLNDPTLSHDDQVMYDRNDLDDGEEWAWEYEPA